MKYVAKVTRVLRAIQSVGGLSDGMIVPVASLPHPDRVEIELEAGPGDPCMMYRYTSSGEFCGDTWHETLERAIAQAGYEYGLSDQDFRAVDP